MSKIPKTDALIHSLSIEQAQTYEAQTDKLIWIETMLLDPLDISHRMAKRVEEALLTILKDASSTELQRPTERPS